MTVPEQMHQSQIPAADDEFDILDLLIAFAKHKRVLFGLPILVAILAYAATNLLSVEYTGKAVIFPPQQQQSSASAMLGQLASLAGGGSGAKTSGDIYLDMLKSNAIADRIVSRFNLQTLYETATLTAARRTLLSRAVFTAQPSGILIIEYEDEDPKLVADIANAFVDELSRLNQVLAVSNASQSRLFYEKQLKKAKDDLVAAEMAMKQMQEKTGMIQLESQGQAAITAAASIRAQIAGKEVEMAAMRSFATERNPEYQRKQQELAGLRAQLSKVDIDSGTLFVPGSKVPELGLEYARRLRDVKYFQGIFEILAKQFEAAKMDEARDTSIIQILDKALPPEAPSGPKRLLIALISAVVTGFFALLWVALREAEVHARRNPVQAARIDTLRSYLKFRH